VSGRERHLVVDTTGARQRAVVHPASVQDRDGATFGLAALAAPGAFPRLRHLWAAAYVAAMVERATRAAGLTVVVIHRTPGLRGFAVRPRRWVVERTFAWLGRYRGKAYEALAASAEARIHLAMTQPTRRRLDPS
jgi:transposase